MCPNQSFEQTPDHACGIVSSPRPAPLNSALGGDIHHRTLVCLSRRNEMQSNPVAWFEIYVQDMDRAKRFYESVFQVTLQQLNSPFPGAEFWAFPADMNSYGACGALVKMEGFSPGGN